ncbi:uncharacterized protein LOC124813212 isoform X1 [Hydra vulgaris]|uniref:uncharacterized protein LOC124813212 isoform X1 n=1 Tax=Hydra vulgaris TaxID=6087 RepID=UPI0032EA099A
MSIEKNHAIATIALSSIELAIGVIVSIASFVIAAKANIDIFMQPYWAGLIFLIPGILGLVSGYTKSRCCMKVFMALNIICVIVGSAWILVFCFIYTKLLNYANKFSECSYNKLDFTCSCSHHLMQGLESCEVLSAIFKLLTLDIVFVFTAVIIALSASILGCAAVCCNRPTNNGAIVMLLSDSPPVTSNILPENGFQPYAYYHS